MAKKTIEQTVWFNTFKEYAKKLSAKAFQDGLDGKGDYAFIGGEFSMLHPEDQKRVKEALSNHLKKTAEEEAARNASREAILKQKTKYKAKKTPDEKVMEEVQKVAEKPKEAPTPKKVESKITRDAWQENALNDFKKHPERVDKLIELGVDKKLHPEDYKELKSKGVIPDSTKTTKPIETPKAEPPKKEVAKPKPVQKKPDEKVMEEVKKVAEPPKKKISENIADTIRKENRENFKPHYAPKKMANGNIVGLLPNYEMDSEDAEHFTELYDRKKITQSQYHEALGDLDSYKDNKGLTAKDYIDGKNSRAWEAKFKDEPKPKVEKKPNPRKAPKVPENPAPKIRAEKLSGKDIEAQKIASKVESDLPVGKESVQKTAQKVARVPDKKTSMPKKFRGESKPKAPKKVVPPKEPDMALKDDINKFMDMYDEHEAENVVKRAKSDVEFPKAGKSPVNKMVNTKDKSRLLDYSKVRAEEKLAGITPPEFKKPVSTPVEERPFLSRKGRIPSFEGEAEQAIQAAKDAIPKGISRMEKVDIPEEALTFKPPKPKFEPSAKFVKGLGTAAAVAEMMTEPTDTVSAEDELDAITENEMHDAEARQFAKTKAMHAGKKNSKPPTELPQTLKGADLPKSPKQKESNLEKDVDEVARKTLSPRKKTTVLWKKGDSEDEFEVDSPEDMSDEEIIAIIKRQMMKDE